MEGQTLGLEPDFLLRVGSERINEATTIEEAVQYIEAVCAFIELPVYLNNPDSRFVHHSRGRHLR